MWDYPMFFDWQQKVDEYYENAARAFAVGSYGAAYDWCKLAVEARRNAFNPPEIECPF